MAGELSTSRRVGWRPKTTWPLVVGGFVQILLALPWLVIAWRLLDYHTPVVADPNDVDGDPTVLIAAPAGLIAMTSAVTAVISGIAAMAGSGVGRWTSVVIEVCAVTGWGSWVIDMPTGGFSAFAAGTFAGAAVALALLLVPVRRSGA
jgi:hypothetical protein